MRDITEVKIRRFNDGHTEDIVDLVAAESVLTIQVNGERQGLTMCSPSHLKELALGYLLAGGIISTATRVTGFSVDEEKVMVNVLVPEFRALPNRTPVRTSGCGLGEVYLEALSEIGKNSSPLNLTIEQLFSAVTTLGIQSHIFRQTGGVHSAGLYHVGELGMFFEDIGRHNAIDKVLGCAFLQEIDLWMSALVMSGRISSEMVLKAGRMRVPVLVSRSAPTSLAVDLAGRLGITLVGFVRGRRLNIYTCPERVLATTFERH
ncbi:MAG: Sulfurtransferase FdhD [Firmicutes bacterium]|nr:Sulfurtransferase FdhD [Bacillota bacterium]